MATPKGYTFNADSARRIADVVKRVEGQPTSTTGTPSGVVGLTVARPYHVKIGSPRGHGKYDATLLTASESEIDPDGHIEVVAGNTLEIGTDSNVVESGTVWPCQIMRRPTPGSPVLFVSFTGFKVAGCST